MSNYLKVLKTRCRVKGFVIPELMASSIKQIGWDSVNGRVTSSINVVNIHLYTLVE